MQILRTADCPLAPIAGRQAAVVGYGNQGRAHALNLRDSGVVVAVGARADGRGSRAASNDGFTVREPLEAALGAEIVAVLLPDEAQKAFVDRLTAASAGRPPKLLVFAHGFVLRFDPPVFPPSWTVVVIAPASPGVQVRDRFVAGSGVPAIFAVHQDGEVHGEGLPLARAYCAALGSSRAGLLVATVAQEAEVDLFGEQAVLCGGMNALTTAAFETLVEAGYPEEMAYLECVQQLRLTAELVERYGVAGMRRRISPTALFGDLTRGPRIVDAEVRRRMAEILGEVRDGEFAREWLGQLQKPVGSADETTGNEASLERAGRVIRDLYNPTVDSRDEPV